MPRKKHSPERVITKLRGAEAALAQGRQYTVHGRTQDWELKGQLRIIGEPSAHGLGVAFRGAEP